MGLNWCINACYPRYMDSSNPNDPCFRSYQSALRMSCDLSQDPQEPEAAQFAVIVARADPTGTLCDNQAADPECTEVIGDAIQLTPVDDNGFSTTYCNSLDVPAGECANYFGYYDWDPSFIYFCAAGADGCVGLGQDGKQYCPVPASP